MAGETTPVVFITANVGSIFEDPSLMLKTWTEEFLSTIARLDPKFVALHCQEVGGKNYEKSMQYVEDFVELLVNSDELRLFDKARIYLDEDYSSAENFTALGNFYFIHESITDALIYDFEERRFVEVEGKSIYSNNIESVQTKEKSKFPLEYFPECKWSRKGFLRTRWCLNETIFDLVNIHLFHDVSNFVAIKSFPSVYSDTRRRALAYTLERFQTDEYGPVPLFVFGDFNFRTDTQGVVKHLSEGLNSSCQEDEVSIIQFKQEDKVILSLGKKEFSHTDHQTIFTTKEGDWLREFDRELEAFADQLFEFEISFPPSYPFEENSSGDRCYMKTRCPAWCDRVVLSHSAIPLVKESENVTYSIMGRNTCMGDHKPVYLKFDIKSSSAKKKWPQISSVSKTETQEKMANGTISNTNSDGKPDSGVSSHSGLKYSELEIEKLACSLEALMSQNSSFSREIESNIEPDLSRCTSCRMHQNPSRVGNNPGGEEVSSDNLVLDDKKIIALLASEIKVPEELLQKIDIQDTGQKYEKEASLWECKSNEKLERFGAVKRVNSASLVEHPPKKEDWKNTRCNSDVAWSPSTSIQNQSFKSWKSSKQFNRGNSRIRLISSSNSLNGSLPRLTSHHSSSDEEWFEEIEEGDDDVLRMNDREKDEAPVDLCPEYCGDKGAVAKGIKPAAECVSRTNLLIDTKGIRAKRIPEEVPSNSASCGVVVATKSSEGDTGSGLGKPVDSSLSLDGSKSKQKHASKTGLPLNEKESKNSSKSYKSKSLSILKRLTEGRKESHAEESPAPQNEALARIPNRESFETLIVEPTLSETGSGVDSAKEALESFGESEPPAAVEEKQRQQDEVVVVVGFAEDEVTGQKTISTESWETIELGGGKTGDREVPPNQAGEYHRERMKTKTKKKKKMASGDDTTCCCVLQ